MADEPETMAEVRARANSHDGCPTDIFDRALAAHDARVRRDAARETLDGLARDQAQKANRIFTRGGEPARRNRRMVVADEARRYRDTHYPETEDQT